MENQRELTPKEKKVIEVFNSARPGIGANVEKNIRNSATGWTEIIEGMDESEIVVREGYRRL